MRFKVCEIFNKLINNFLQRKSSKCPGVKNHVKRAAEIVRRKFVCAEMDFKHNNLMFAYIHTYLAEKSKISRDDKSE